MNSDLNQAKPVNPKPVRKSDRGIDSVDVLVFLIPCVQFIQVNVVGVLNGSDILLLATFAYLAFYGRIRIASPAGKRFVVLCLVYLFSQCVTDIVRHTVFADYARGWSNIGFTIVNFAVLSMLLYGRPKRLMIYAGGLAVGTLLTLLITPSENMKDDPWKFGIAYPVCWIVMLFASRKGCGSYEQVLLCVIAGVVNVVMGSRGVGGFCLAVALYLLLMRRISRKGVRVAKWKASSIIALAAALILGAAGIFWAYGYAAGTGILGEEARKKYEAQASGRFGVLLGGRSELLSSIPAIYDSPILGHGSWAKDPKYLIIQRQALAMLGYQDAGDVGDEEVKSGVIPTHSYILGAWVNAGILGALFWGWVFVLTAKMLLRVYPTNFRLLPLASFAAVTMLWDILFSPYGLQQRIISPYYVVLLMSIMDAAARQPAARQAASATRGILRSRLKTA